MRLVWYPMGVAKLARAPTMTTNAAARGSSPAALTAASAMGNTIAAAVALASNSVRMNVAS